MLSATEARQEQRLKQRQSPRRLWHLFWSLTLPYLRFAPGAKLNVLWVIFLILLRSAFVVAFSFLSRDFWTALQHKDVTAFWRLIRLFTFILICALPTLVWTDYAQSRLSLRWRRWLTEKVLTDYFAHRNFYHLDTESSVDNPDQRIADDVDAFTATSLSFFTHVFRALIDLFNFSAILFSIYPQLFLVLVVYSTLGTFIAIVLGRRLINLNFLQLQKEADFRYSLIRVRENAESIAFYTGERRERAETTRRLHAAVLNRVHLLVWTRNLAFFTESYTYLVEILPLAIIAPLYFDSVIEMGVVSQASQAFRHILSDLSIIVHQFDRISAFSAGVDRLGELEQFMYDRFDRAENTNGTISSIESSRFRDSDGKGDKDGDGDESGKGNEENRPQSSKDSDVNNDTQSAVTYGREYTLQKFRSLKRRNIISEGFSTQADDFIPPEDGAHATAVTEGDDKERLNDMESGRGAALITTKILPNSVDVDEENLRDIGADDGYDDQTSTKSALVHVHFLTLLTPDWRRRVLFSDVTFTLPRGGRLLVVGPSGTGKSSLLRAIAGLWTAGYGHIERPALNKMFFLPQKPYCTLGTLREQLLYPIPLEEATTAQRADSTLQDALDVAGLPQLPGRMGGLDEVYDWGNVLSLGEQQRLAFARLVLARPMLAILDECSSALDVVAERRVYEYLTGLGVGFLSVGHRPTLFRYHDFVLRVGGRYGKSFSFKRIVDGVDDSEQEGE